MEYDSIHLIGLNKILHVKLLEQCLAHSKLLYITVLLATSTIELRQTGLRKFTVYETGSVEEGYIRVSLSSSCISLFSCTQK